ncbi:hypothetical protein CASFOL_000780 [Castilleja foliolosa]|uniref:DUF4219 domain-containing protein n=1 Tax=Castilleja foliolosa TaxID=1961234 RepID=A0ABD3EPH6_9LAMI
MSTNLISLVSRFNGEKFDYWSNLMKLCLESQDLWSIVEDGIETPKNDAQLTDAEKRSLKNERQKDRKALFQIYQTIEVPVYEKLTKAKSSKEVRLQSLRAEFEKLELKENEKIVDYFTRVTSLVNQMATNSEVMKIQQVVEIIMRSLPMKFDHIVVAIEESQDFSSMALRAYKDKDGHDIP